MKRIKTFENFNMDNIYVIINVEKGKGIINYIMDNADDLISIDLTSTLEDIDETIQEYSDINILLLDYDRASDDVKDYVDELDHVTLDANKLSPSEIVDIINK